MIVHRDFRLGHRALGLALACAGALAACSRAPATEPDLPPWRADLAALASELPKRHANAFFQVSEADWRKQVAELDSRLATLDDAHAIAGLMRVVAAVGDGHTMLAAFGKHGVYRLALIWFDDGIFVAGADDEAVIGKKLVGIGGKSIDDVIAVLAPLVARDNDAWLHAQIPRLLVDAAMLAGTDLAAGDRATFRLAAADGSVQELALTPQLIPASIAPPKSPPLHLQGPATNYWNKYVEADRTIYLAYNACADDSKVGPFVDFAAQTLAFADQHPVDKLVVDLRRNGGGNSRVLEPLIAGLAARPAIKVYAIIGMHTFSSAMLNAMELKRSVHATLVGGPTGGKPSGYGEVKTFQLPKSGLVVQYSTKLFSNPDFAGNAVTPDVPVRVIADDWFSGRDPQMDAVRAGR